MLKKSVDPYGALLAYRTTSLECGYSPAQLLMGRQLRTSIPVMASTLQPRWDESKQLRDRQENIKTRYTVLLLAYVSQISRPVEASQALVSSSRLTIPSLPDGGRCCGQTSKMWSTVCSGAPHSQTEESVRPHFSMDELNRPTPVRRRLRDVHCFRGKSRPGTLCGSRMKLCSLEGGAASQSSFQRVLSQDCFVTPGGAKSLR